MLNKTASEQKACKLFEGWPVAVLDSSLHFLLLMTMPGRHAALSTLLLKAGKGHQHFIQCQMNLYIA